jgi:hypothetical protein
MDQSAAKCAIVKRLRSISFVVGTMVASSDYERDKDDGKGL